MKYAHLTRYKITLKTLSPVFIGSSSSEKLAKNEFVVDTRYGIVYVPDLPLLIDTIDQHGCMDEFEKFLQKDANQQGGQSLYQFLQAMCIPITQKEKWVKYILRIGSREINTVNTLSRFIKNADGVPYIPGSSIKGAIRTALIASRITQDQIKNVMESAKREPRSRRTGGEEEYPLRSLKLINKEGDAINDLLRALSISDCAPFNGESLFVCKKLEFDSDGNVRGNADGNRRGKTSPPLFRECLMPGLTTHFYLTLDSGMCDQSLTIGQIQNALCKWDQIQENYINDFYVDDIKLDRTKEGKMPITLGGGVGFQSKSIIYACPDSKVVRGTVENILQNQFSKTYKPRYTNDPAPYRLKIVTCNGKYYTLGRCSLDIQEG